MDPWAESTTDWPPKDEGRTTPSPSLPNGSSDLTPGSVIDPWAEPPPPSSSSSSSTIPVVSSQSRISDSSQEYAGKTRFGSVGDFDPWGGNTAPIAPLSTAYTSTIADDEAESDAKEEIASPTSWSETNRDEGAHSIQLREDDYGSSIANGDTPIEEPTIADEDDPWGSGAAARRIKMQQEAESAAQRMEILRLQEEAKGNQIDEEGNSVESKSKEKGNVEQAAVTAKDSEEQSASEAPAPAGWRSLFSRATAKTTTSADTKASEEKPKLDTNVAGRNSESKESPHSSTSVAAPRLWQAPSILGSHNRSASTTSRSGSVKEALASTPPPATKGPGWEVATKKQLQNGGGGGLMQSLFGVASGSNDNEGSTTISATRKEEKATGLNRFGRGLQPPPVVSAADEDDSFETEETGIEWESGDAFETKNKRDLLSDDADEKQTESTLGKLIGRLRARNSQAGRAPDDFSKADLSWLESVGANPNSTQSSLGTEPKVDSDWLTFMDEKPSTSTISQQQDVTLSRSSSSKYKISSTSKGSINSRIPPPLAPPPSSSSIPSPFSFRGPTTTKSTPLLASQAISKNTANQDTFNDFESAYMDESPNPDEGYRDDVVDNALLRGNRRPEAAQKSNSFLKSFQSQSRYNYDEDDADSHDDDNWTAFRDNGTSHHRPYTDVHDIASRSSTPSALDSKSVSKGLGVSSKNNGILPPPPPNASSNRPLSWDRNAPLQPPPGHSHPTAMVKQISQPIAPVLPVSKPKTLSQGNTLTNDDLRFFENL